MENELSEFVVLPQLIAENESYRWTRGDTLSFLDLYQNYRKQVGSLRIKSLKKMFEEISKELIRITKKQISPGQCENRWKVLERAYKKYVLNINTTGSARRDFEYADVMTNILGKKKNIHPEILLDAETVENVSNDPPGAELNELLPNESSNEVKVQKVSDPGVSKKIISQRRQYQNKSLKSHLLKEIRMDRQRYYEKRIDQENRKIDVKIEKNRLLQEKNNILREISNKLPTTSGLL